MSFPIVQIRQSFEKLQTVMPECQGVAFKMFQYLIRFVKQKSQADWDKLNFHV